MIRHRNELTGEYRLRPGKSKRVIWFERQPYFKSFRVSNSDRERLAKRAAEVKEIEAYLRSVREECDRLFIGPKAAKVK